MDNNRFDNLTRGIAQGVSRREVLKLLSAGILGVMFGRYASPQTEVLAGGLVCPDNNKVTGTCQALKDCINQGVIDDQGVHRAGYNCKDEDGLSIPCCTDAEGLAVPCVGWTNSSFEYSYGPSNRSQRNGKNNYCITWVVKSPFSVHSEKSWFTWVPNPAACNCPTCRTKNKEWSDNIKAHEEHHERDAQTEVTMGNANWNRIHRKPYKLCGPDPQRIAEALEQKIINELDKAVTSIKKAAKKRAVAWDDRDRANSKPPPCDACAPPVSCNDPCVPCSNSLGRLAVSLFQDCSCEGVTCPECMHCENGVCVSTCTACQTCQDGTCVDTCGECTACNSDTGACEPCRACQVCENGACVDHCGECSHCEPEGCVSDCVTGEHCCDGQCINLSQYKCCTTLAGSFVCPSNLECCAGSQTCCDPNVEQCCGGVCMSYGDSNCQVGACIPCGSDQFCCLRADGRPFGCCPTGHNCDPVLGCQ